MRLYQRVTGAERLAGPTVCMYARARCVTHSRDAAWDHERRQWRFKIRNPVPDAGFSAHRSSTSDETLGHISQHT